MESWINALRFKCGPLTDAASVFAAQLGVERDPPRGVPGLLTLARAISRRASDASDEHDDRLFVELAGAYLGLLLCETLEDAAHVHERGSHRLRLGRRGFFDPFAAVERALLADDTRTALAHEVAVAEAEARDQGPLSRVVLEAERQLEARGFAIARQFESRLELLTRERDSVEIDLERVVRAAAFAPAPTMQRAVERLLSALPDANGSTTPLAEVQGRILPRPVGPRLLAGLGAQGALATMPLVGAAKLCFVIRYETRARYVRERELEDWGLGAGELRRLAVRNLAARSERATLLRVEGDHGPYVVARSGDGLDAARLLLPGLAELLADELGAPFAVAVPHRDTLLACSLDAEGSLRELRAQARDAALRAPHAILGELLRVERDGRLALLSG